MRWLGDHPYLLVPLGVLVAFVVMRLGFGALRMLGSPPPEETTATADVEAYDVRYRCHVCGTEVRLTRIADDDDFEPPRHCREDMSLVVEAEP